jgi:hypothetical protein
MKSACRFLIIVVFPLLLTACMDSSSNFGSPATSLNGAVSGSGSPSSSSSLPVGDVMLTWNANSGEQTGFYIEQSSDGVNFTQIQTIPDGVNQTTVSGLSQGKTYYFRVRGYNPVGTSLYSQTLTASIP